MASSSNSLSLARFAFNIYGSLGTEPRHPKQAELCLSSKRLIYACETEITCLANFNHSLRRLNLAFVDASADVPSHHVVIGGKNYLKLLALDADQSSVVADINLVDPNPLLFLRLHSSLKLFNVNTIKCNGDMVACGLNNGTVSVFQVSGNGKSRLAYRLEDHKRAINSLDFVEQDQVLLSGSQDGTVKLWDLRLPGVRPAMKLLASQHSDPVRSCQYSPHSRVRGKLTVLSVHDSGSLCKFDFRYPASSNSNFVLPERKWTFHTGPALSLSIHPESERVLTGGRDRRICVWNYGDLSLNSGSPETTLNTYGPVMKIRWNNFPNELVLDRQTDFADNIVRPHSVYNYDFACLYLNDDPTITVYNLSRKYVPKEIVTTTSHKAVQNFIWSNNPRGGRRLWTITKSNTFVSYNLDATDMSEYHQNILRPAENLPTVATAWSGGFANLALVTQDTNDFTPDPSFSVDLEQENLEKSFNDDYAIEEDRFAELHTSSMSIETSHSYGKSGPANNSLPNPSNLFFQKSQSFKDRPLLIRSASHFPVLKSPSPISHQRSTLSENFASIGQSIMRPTLGRNASQSTDDSVSLSPFYVQSQSYQDHHNQRRIINLASPYLVSLSLPIPQADDEVFDILASNYLVSIPDGCTLAFVCLVNSHLASGVQRLRQSQIWRIISVALEQEDLETLRKTQEPEEQSESDVAEKANNENIAKSPDDAKSISSELGNVVGSYNSNSTLNTNYGGVPRRSESNSSVNNLAILGSSKDSSRGAHSLKGVFKSPSYQSLIDMNRHLGAHGLSTSPPLPRSISKKSLLQPSKSSVSQGDADNAIEVDEFDEESHGVMARGNSLHSEVSRKGSHLDLHSAAKPMAIRRSPSGGAADFIVGELSPHNSAARKSSFLRARQPSQGASHSALQPWSIPGTSQDLDNENENILTNASVSFSSSVLGSSGHGAGASGRTRASSLSRNSPVATTQGLNNKGNFSLGRNYGAHRHSANNLLGPLTEDSIHSVETKPSELTKAINGSRCSKENIEKMATDDRPWSSIAIVKKAVEYAITQGDLIMSATLVMLFYDVYGRQFAKQVLSEEASLECLGLYVETLRRKELFTTSASVVKEAPASLKYKLSVYATKEVDMRFYCCWCQKLLTNEISKARYGNDSEKFGFWYCDECSKKQLNCIYCNEPCRGLTVVESLKCGHRGHFGCMREWHLQDGNAECPGGCDELTA